MMRTTAAIADGEGAFSILDLFLGEPQEGEVLVRLRASGIRHTDFDSLRWGRPVVLGHEGAGAGVTRFRPGDRVALNWAIPCRGCASDGSGTRRNRGSDRLGRGRWT